MAHLACPGINGKRSGRKGILPSPFLEKGK